MALLPKSGWFVALACTLGLTGSIVARPASQLLASDWRSSQVRRASALEAVVYRKVKLGRQTCHVVEVDLSNPHVRLQVLRARDLGTRYRTFGSFVRQSKPLAAITGTFFDTATGTIICNLVRGGQLMEAGRVGHTFSLDENNRPCWMQTAGSPGHAMNWGNSDFAVSSGPTLVRQGRLALNPRAEGFRDPGLFRKASRTGIATTAQGKLLLVTVNQPVSLKRFAEMMTSLGAQDALNLDGGSSTALYARGRYLSRPGRRLTNVVLVTVRPGDPVPEEIGLEAMEAEESLGEPTFDFEPEPGTEPEGLAPAPDRVELPEL